MRAALTVGLMALLAAAAVHAAERRAPADGTAARMQALVSQVSAERDAARADVARLGGELDTVRASEKKTAAALTAAQAEIEALRRSLDAFQTQNGALRTSLGERTQAHRALSGEHRAAQAQLRQSLAARAEIAAERESCEGRVRTLQDQNLTLYRTGMEVLDRYAGTGFKDVVRTREPFVGHTRVQLENQVQDYRFRLEDARAAADAPPTAAPSP